MSTVKYQIFVSSTLEDLRKEREAVIQAVLEMGHIPVGMEMFSAADEEQWKIITRQIDQSDYYIVIVAQRYGSIVKELDISYSEREYDYAVGQKVPILGFVIDEKATWPGDRVDRNTTTVKELEAFKAKVKSRPVGFWSTTEELHVKVAIALGKAINTSPRPGWIRATQGASVEVLEELARLSKENAELVQLRKENEELRNQLRSAYRPVTLQDYPWLNTEFSVKWRVASTLSRLAKRAAREDSDIIDFFVNDQINLRTTWQIALKYMTKSFLVGESTTSIMSNLEELLFDCNKPFFVQRGYTDASDLQTTLVHRYPDRDEFHVELMHKEIIVPIALGMVSRELTNKGSELFLLLDKEAKTIGGSRLFVNEEEIKKQD